MTLARRTPMKRTAMKRRAVSSNAEFHPSVRGAIERRSGGWCEANTPDCLTYPHRATMVHHRLRRSKGGMGTFENGLHVCAIGHHYIHANPAEAYANGWMVRSGSLM